MQREGHGPALAKELVVLRGQRVLAAWWLAARSRPIIMSACGARCASVLENPCRLLQPCVCTGAYVTA
eukprot:359094-Chlamydomonas_euryale.AAC.26